MPKQKSKFTISEIKRAISAVSATGLSVFGVTISVDGSIRVETAANSSAAPVQDGVSLVEKWKSKRKGEDEA